MKKIGIGSAILVGVLLVGGVVWLVLSGKLVIIWNGAAVQYSAASNVCGDDVVTAYNSATEYSYRGGLDDGPMIDTEGLAAVVDTVRSRSGYEADPTCQVIIFWDAIQHNDASAAQSALDALNLLHDQRIFPDNNLRTAIPLFEYETAISGLSVTEGASEDQ